MNAFIYDLENKLLSSQLTEYSKSPVMYDIRKISEQIRKLGRPLTDDEAEKYKIQK